MRVSVRLPFSGLEICPKKSISFFLLLCKVYAYLMLDQTSEYFNFTVVKKEKTAPQSRSHFVRWVAFNWELKGFCPYSEV